MRIRYFSVQVSYHCITSIFFLFLFFSASGHAHASDYQLIIGGTKAWPNLGESNRNIHRIEDEIRAIAPGVKEFEDWHDVYSGSVGMGISRKFTVHGWDIWPTLFVAYANGDVRASQDRLPTYLGPALNYKFKQEYTYWGVDMGMLISLLEWNGIVWKLHTYVSLNWLESDTDLTIQMPQAGYYRKVKAEFDDMQPGTAIGTSIEYNFLPWLGLMFTGRYSWCRYRDDTDTKDTTEFYGMPSTKRYKVDTLVDTSGLTIGGYLLLNF